MRKILRATIKGIYKAIAFVLFRPKLINKENMPTETAAIICPNHIHALDSTIIIANTKRKINVLAKEELYINKLICWFADLFNIYPVKRDKKSMESIKISLKILKNKELLMIFPEGTRNGMAKGVKAKDGAIKLAIKANVPIIPVGIVGDFKPFRRVKVKFGEPIYYKDYKEEINNKEVLEDLTEDLMKQIVNLRDEIK